MPSVSDMMGAINIAKTDPFNAASMFKNPAAAGLDGLNGITGKLGKLKEHGMISDLNLSSFSAGLGNYTSLVNTNLTERLKTLPNILPLASAHQAALNAMATADGISTGGGCDFIDNAFRSIKEAQQMAADLMNQAQTAIQSAIDSALGAGGQGLDFVNSTIADIQNWVSGASASVISQIQDAINSAMSAVTSMINDAASSLQNMITSELDAINKMIDDLLDFSFLKGIGNFGPCGNALMGSILDANKLDLGKLASL